jgi:hypothetical protein
LSTQICWLDTIDSMRCGTRIGLLALTVYACGSSNPLTGPSDTAVTFTGRVLDYHTDAPVAGTTVSFTPDAFNSQVVAANTTTGGDGRYTFTVPHTGAFTILIDGAISGLGRVNGRAYRGDLYPRSGNCIARYGLIIDSRSLRPIAGATVTLTGATVTTGADGWYRIDLGCPSVVLPGGTTVIVVGHPRYESRTQVVGRGVAGVSRLDIDMTALH